MQIGKHIPLDGESGHAWLLREHIAANLLDDRLGGRVSNQLVTIVLVVDIVANAHELATVVGAGKENDSHAQELVDRDALSVRGIGLEDKLINADGDRADEEGV
jgi:hypothetical protein